MTGEVMAFFAEENYPSDYPDADTLVLLHYAGFRVQEVPVTMHDRISGHCYARNSLSAVLHRQDAALHRHGVFTLSHQGGNEEVKG